LCETRVHLQYPHAGVIVMHYTALRRLPDELAQYAFEPLRSRFHQLPLRGRRERDPQLAFQPFHAVKGHSGAILQQRDHGHRCRVELFPARRLRRSSREHLAAGVAAQPFHLKHSRLQRRLPDDADQRRRFLLAIHPPFSASGAGITGVKRIVENGHSVRSRECRGTIAPVSRRLWFPRFLRSGCRRWRFRFQHGAGLLRVAPPH